MTGSNGLLEMGKILIENDQHMSFHKNANKINLESIGERSERKPNKKNRKDILMELCRNFDENKSVDLMPINGKQIIMILKPLKGRPIDLLKNLLESFEERE
jgi:hypothetical protein